MATVQQKKRKRQYSKAKRLPKGPNGGIELLLVQSVEHLGRQGDIVEVRPGYANNFLLPQGLAAIATDHHKRMVEKHRAQLEALAAARLEKYRNVAEEIGKLSVTIEANANEEGHLYGSVGPAEIVAALKQHNHTITADQVRLEGPLRELALYTVKIHIHQDVDAELKVWVVPTADSDVAPQPSAES